MADLDAQMIKLLTDIRRLSGQYRAEAELAWSVAVTKEQQAQKSGAEMSRMDAERAWGRAVTREDMAAAQEAHEIKTNSLYDIINSSHRGEVKAFLVKQVIGIEFDLEAVLATWSRSSSTSSSSPSSSSSPKAASGKSKLPQPLSFTSPAKWRRTDVPF